MSDHGWITVTVTAENNAGEIVVLVNKFRELTGGNRKSLHFLHFHRRLINLITPLMHSPIYKSIPLKFLEAKEQIEYMLQHSLI